MSIFGEPQSGVITLVLGGARSGKSRYAEALALGRPSPRLYLATAQALDGEMDERIRTHQQRRGDHWLTREEPLELPGVLRECAAAVEATVLVDCLTLWLSNLMGAERSIDEAIAALIDVCDEVRGHVIFVANEVGLGIVPDNPLARIFRDHAGRLNQRMAARADRVVFVAAGLPLVLKNL